MSTRIPQLDGGGYEKDDDYSAHEEEEEESESSSSSPSDVSDEEESMSDSDQQESSLSLRERKSPRIAAIEEESQSKRSTRQSKKKNEKLTKKKQSGSGDQKTTDKGTGRGRGRPRKAKAQDLNPKPEAEEIVNKMETEDGDFLCVNCKKRYPTQVALNNHAYWCAPKRITRSRGGGGLPASRPGTSQQKQKTEKKEPKKRGRKPQASKQPTVNNLNDHVFESDYVSLTSELDQTYGECDEEAEVYANNVTQPEEEWVESAEESDYETKVNSDSQPICESASANLVSAHDTEDVIYDDDEESEIPVSCSNCKMTYRNVASLKKHLAACMYVSSSASEDETQDNAESQNYELEDANEHVIPENESISDDVQSSNTPFFSDNLQLDQNAAIEATQPEFSQIQLTTTPGRTINSYAQFQPDINATNSNQLLPNSSNNIIPTEFPTQTTLPESQPVEQVGNQKLYNEAELGTSIPQLIPNAVEVYNASNPNESCLLKQALSSSIYSTVPTGSNFQYSIPTQSRINPEITVSGTLGQPYQGDGINGVTRNSSDQLSSLPPLSVSQGVPESLRNDTTGVSNSMLQDRYKSFNSLGLGNFQPHSTIPESATTSTQLQIVGNSGTGSIIHQKGPSITGMNQQPVVYSEMEKLQQLPNCGSIQRLVSQNSEYFMSPKNTNPPTVQNEIMRFNVPANSSQSLMPQQVNQQPAFLPKPQQPQPTVQAYQTVTIQGENGQLYRVNIPVPQSAINCNVQIDGSNDQTQKDIRNAYNSSQFNYANNSLHPPQAVQEGSLNLDGHQNFRRLTYSSLSSESAHIRVPNINVAHLNSQLHAGVNNPAIAQQIRLNPTPSNNSFSQYSYSSHAQEFPRMPQQVPVAQYQTGNFCQGQEANLYQNSHILQQKQLASQLGIQFPQEHGIKLNGESGTSTNPSFHALNSTNFINSPLTSNSQQHQHVQEQQQIMYQQEIARQQLLQHQSEQAQKHYHEFQQQQQSVNGPSKQDLLPISATPGMLAQNISSSSISSHIISGSQYNNSTGLGLGQGLPTQFNQNYLMQNTSNPSLISHVQKLQHSQGQTMSVPQGVYNQLAVPQNQQPLPCESRSTSNADDYNQSQSRTDCKSSIQSIKPGTSSALITQTNAGQPQMNIPVPYQIVQGPDGTTYIIVQSSPSLNPQSSAANLGTRSNTGLNSLTHNNISEIVQSALISNQSNNVNNAIQSLQGSSFNIEAPCTANSLLNSPCICQKCTLSRSLAAGPDKYRKVLPSPRPIEPKVTPSENQISSQISSSESSVPLFVKTYMKKHGGKTVKTQLANMIIEKQITSAVNGEAAGDSNIILNQMNEDISPNSDAGALRKNPVLTAVVRPMEHPLQKMSDQISQIESIFSATPTLVPVRSTENPATLSENERKDTRGISHATQSLNSSAPQGNSNIQPTVDLTEDSSTTMQRAQVNTGAKRKGGTVSASPAKSIKVTLKRKERGDSYCINDISETGASSGPMRSIKIKAKITTGELAGTSTDVVVEPKIHIVPIPDPDSDDLDSNLTIAENDAPIVGPIVSGPAQDAQDTETNGAKLVFKISLRHLESF